MMENTKTQFEQYLAGEVSRYKGVAVPVRSGLLRRALVRHLPVKKIHPNPEDEFCSPEVGPGYSIISGYEQEIIRARRYMEREKIKEPLTVERIRPDGYMLINGHHRWAAALLMGETRVPVRVVNLTTEMDIRLMLKNSRHERRAALDLDEVVFCGAEDAPAEKALGFPFGRIYRDRLARGIPALFRYLNTHGYDIWVYTSGLYSMEHIRQLFRLYHLRVHGIVTGTGRKKNTDAAVRKRIEAEIAAAYPETLHIDRRTVLRMDSGTGEYSEYGLTGDPETWSQEVMKILGELDADGSRL